MFYLEFQLCKVFFSSRVVLVWYNRLMNEIIIQLSNNVLFGGSIAGIITATFGLMLYKSQVSINSKQKNKEKVSELCYEFKRFLIKFNSSFSTYILNIDAEEEHTGSMNITLDEEYFKEIGAECKKYFKELNEFEFELKIILGKDFEKIHSSILYLCIVSLSIEDAEKDFVKNNLRLFNEKMDIDKEIKKVIENLDYFIIK